MEASDKVTDELAQTFNNFVTKETVENLIKQEISPAIQPLKTRFGSVEKSVTNTFWASQDLKKKVEDLQKDAIQNLGTRLTNLETIQSKPQPKHVASSERKTSTAALKYYTKNQQNP